MKKETFKSAYSRIISGLKDEGWYIAESNNIPCATSPDEMVRYWFKPKAVYRTTNKDGVHKVSHAVSIGSDQRELSHGRLIRMAEAASKILDRK